MPPTKITNTLYSWASDAEPGTLDQARKTRACRSSRATSP